MKIKPSSKRGRVGVEVERKDEPRLAPGTPDPGPPLALERILVPVDFSECAQKALQYALPMAQRFGAKLVLLFVMPVNYYVGSEFGAVDFPVPAGEWREMSRKELQGLAQREIGSCVPFEALVREGQPAQEIAACAQEVRADLIVISTHGRTGLRHVLLGSVAENVVRHAPCPVLVVREQEREFIGAKGRQVPRAV